MKQSTKLAIAALAAIGFSNSSASAAATQWVDVACGNSNSFLLDKKGNLWTTGFGGTGTLGFKVFSLANLNGYITSWKKTKAQVSSISTAFFTTFAILKNGNLVGSGGTGMGDTGISKPVGAKWKTLMDKVVFADTDSLHSILIRTDGSVWTTGVGINGELGNNIDLSEIPPFSNSIRKEDRWTHVFEHASSASVFSSGSAIITTDGMLMVTGQLGNLSTSTWTPITDNIQSLSKGTELFAIDKSGNLLSFSASTTAPNGVAWQIEMSGIRSVASNSKQTFAVTTQGELLGKGENTEGELGVGDAKPRTDWAPVLDRVAKVAACTNHSLALRTNGEIWATGDNSQGQFGDPKIPSGLAWVRIK